MLLYYGHTPKNIQEVEWALDQQWRDKLNEYFYFPDEDERKYLAIDYWAELTYIHKRAGFNRFGRYVNAMQG